MPPTLKDSSMPLSSPEMPERASDAPGSRAEASNAKPVALEVPVTVNGARAVEGSEKREPFSETTRTVLVLASGAVIRLSSSVAPGQLLFLTNEKTKKEVICQVVKSKNYRSASGYVELEFTEPVLGFWGIRFPGDRISGVASPAGARKLDPAVTAEPPKSTEPKATSYADTRQPSENVTSNLADAVQEFKTEIKADSRPTSKADFLAPAETSIDGLKLEANRLQEQLSALLFAEGEAKPPVPAGPSSKQELGDAAAKILAIANEEPAAVKLPAPAATADLTITDAAPKETQAASKSSFENEEVQIPAWLEPLARNAGVHAPRDEEGADDSGNESDDWKAPETLDSAPVQKPSLATIPKKPTSTRKQPSTAAVFGNSLMGDTSAELSKPRGGGKGIGLAIAAGLLLAAGGAWYFRGALGFAGPANEASHTNSLTASVAPVVPVNSSPTLAVSPNASSANALTEAPAAASSANPGKVQTAAITERIPKANSGNESIKAAENPVEVVEPEIRRPSLGSVRLAKPKVGRSASVPPNGVTEPALELSGDGASTGESSLSANFAESTNQPAAPAAPLAVGGDVRPARMISSVPPVYPALAKSQHVAGDVRVDALIDANGRVSTMKVVSGPSLLHQAAMDALRQWKYQAAMLDGKAVAMHLTVTIQFRLQ